MESIPVHPPQPRPRVWSRVGFVVGLVILGMVAYFLLNWKFVLMYALGELDGPFYNTARLADLDADGDLDIVLHNLREESETTSWSNITFWYNQGGGRFSASSMQYRPFHSTSLDTADVDADGVTDLAVMEVMQLVFHRNAVLDNDAQRFRIWKQVHPQEDPGTPGPLRLGDLDGDGVLDAFIGGCCGMQLERQDGGDDYLPSHAWVWTSSGGAASLSHLGDLRMRDFALGDLDGDGDLDVFAALLQPKPGKDGSPANRVLWNDGAGGFTDSGQRLGMEESYAVALGDLDGDADLDALVGNQTGAQLWLNQGGRQEGQTGELAAGQELGKSALRAVFLADLDRDGDLDALLGGVQMAEIWWNDGQGSFAASGVRFRYSERHALAVGDVNADGLPDIFAGSYDMQHSVWLNQGSGKFRSGFSW